MPIGTLTRYAAAGRNIYSATVRVALIAAFATTCIVVSPLTGHPAGTKQSSSQCENIKDCEDIGKQACKVAPIEKSCLVGVGRSLVLQAPQGFAFATEAGVVSNDNICEIKKASGTVPSYVVIKGKRPGKTHVTLWFGKDNKEYRPITYLIRVAWPDDEWAELENWLNVEVVCPKDEFSNDDLLKKCRKRYKITLHSVPTSDEVVVRGKVRNRRIADRVLTSIAWESFPENKVIDMMRVPGVRKPRRCCW